MSCSNAKHGGCFTINNLRRQGEQASNTVMLGGEGEHSKNLQTLVTKGEDEA